MRGEKQQRARRFKSAQEAAEKEEEEMKLRAEWAAQGRSVPPRKEEGRLAHVPVCVFHGPHKGLYLYLCGAGRCECSTILFLARWSVEDAGDGGSSASGVPAGPADGVGCFYSGAAAASPDTARRSVNICILVGLTERALRRGMLLRKWS